MRTIVTAMLLVGAGVSCVAAGMSCERAKSPSEKKICSTPALLKRDAELAGAFAKLRRHGSVDQADLMAGQKKWLARRDACHADDACLDGAHVERIDELQRLLWIAASHQPDSVDLMTAQSLSRAITDEIARDPERPAEQVLTRLEVTRDVTRFANTPSEPGVEEAFDGSAFPRKRPAGVTEAEWKALRLTGVEGGGEHGAASYVLIDLDRDGHRDLVVDSYTGGTGLFSSISLLKGGPGKFAGKVFSAATDVDDAQPLFTLNGRGSNQSYRWILLNGRVYAAYTEGFYGVDTIYLLRPFTDLGATPAIKVEYGYQFTVPTAQDQSGRKTELDLKTADNLRRAIAPLNQAAGEVAKPAVEHVGPICPTAQGSPDAEPETSYGPGHYSYEIVADLPVWLDGECHIGRAIDWFGAYSAKDGLNAMLWVRKPLVGDEATDAAEQEFQLRARRKAVRVTSVTAAFDGR